MSRYHILISILAKNHTSGLTIGDLFEGLGASWFQLVDADSSLGHFVDNIDKNGAAKALSSVRGTVGPHFKHRVASSASASSGKILTKKKGSVIKATKGSENSGPRYSGVNAGRPRALNLAHQSTKARPSFRDLAGISCIDRVRVGVKLGYLEKKELCSQSCGLL
jgi:hypothetical protein